MDTQLITGLVIVGLFVLVYGGSFLKSLRKRKVLKLLRAQDGSRRPVVIIDVRSRQEYVVGHVEGAINIPADQIQQASKKIPSKDQLVIVYCATGTRAAAAALALKGQGYQNVYNAKNQAGVLSLLAGEN